MVRDREPLLRKLTANDTAAALELSTEAGWNQTENDWRQLFDLSSEGCLAIDVAGEVVQVLAVDVVADGAAVVERDGGDVVVAAHARRFDVEVGAERAGP